MNLDDLALDQGQRLRLADFGVRSAAQLQGMLALPDVATHLAGVLGLDAAGLAILRASLVDLGLDPAAVPPEPPRRSGVTLPPDDDHSEEPSDQSSGDPRTDP